MKKQLLLILIILGLTHDNIAQPWMTNGNGAITPLNFLGPTNNAALYYRTFNINRAKLNHTLAYTVNTLPGVRDGYFLLGLDASVTGGTLYGAGNGAFSLLHLSGSNPTGFAQEFGYRSWMQTGITFTDNDDRAYVGYKKNANDVSDFILNWSDNSVIVERAKNL